MNYVILLALTSISCQLFSMNNPEQRLFSTIKPGHDTSIIGFENIVTLFRDKNLTSDVVKCFFQEPVDPKIKTAFLKSPEAACMKAVGKMYLSSKNGEQELYEFENAFAGLIVLAHCQKGTKEKLILVKMAYAVLDNYEWIQVAKIEGEHRAQSRKRLKSSNN